MTIITVVKGKRNAEISLCVRLRSRNIRQHIIFGNVERLENITYVGRVQRYLFVGIPVFKFALERNSLFFFICRQTVSFGGVIVNGVFSFKRNFVDMNRATVYGELEFYFSNHSV